MMPSTPAMAATTAAMMLPGALPAIVRSARANHTPVARACRRRCRAEVRSGLRFGGWCLSSSLGLMTAFVALDAMSLPLMCAAGAVALIQKELLS